MTIQMKATEQCFPEVLFIMLHKVVLTFKPMDEILKCDHVNKTYSSVLSCAIVQCITLYNMVLTFEFVDEIIPCAHKNESGISR